MSKHHKQTPVYVALLMVMAACSETANPTSQNTLTGITAGPPPQFYVPTAATYTPHPGSSKQWVPVMIDRDNVTDLTLMTVTSRYGIGDVAWSPDGTMIAVASWEDGDGIHVYDIESFAEPKSSFGLGGKYGVHSVAFSQDGQRLFAVRRNGGLEIWNTSTWKIEDTLDAPTNGRVAISPDGTRLAVGGMRKETPGYTVVELFDLSTLQPITDYAATKGAPINSLMFDPTHYLLSAIDGLDGPECREEIPGLQVWDMETGAPANQIRFPYGCGIRFAAIYSPDGQSIVSINTMMDTESISVNLWERDTGKIIRRLLDAPDVTGLGEVAFNPQGDLLAALLPNDVIHFWDASTWDEIRSFQVNPEFAGGQYNMLRFSPNGTLLLTITGYRQIQLWGIP